MFNLSKQTIIILASIWVLSSCSDSDKTVDSDDVSTGQIYATFQIISDGGEYVHAEAQLTKGVPPNSSNDDEIFVYLTEGDELWFSAGESIDEIDFSGDLFGQFSALSDTQDKFSETRFQEELSWFIFGRVIINRFGTWYSANLPQSENGEYRFSLLRNKGRTSNDSVVTLAEDFNIITPESGTSFSRSADDIIVQWNNLEPATQVELESHTTCSNNNVDSHLMVITADAGTATIPSGSLSSETLVGLCSTTLNIRKVKSGQVDNKFLAGAVHSYQIRRVVFNTTD